MNSQTNKHLSFFPKTRQFNNFFPADVVAITSDRSMNSGVDLTGISIVGVRQVHGDAIVIIKDADVVREEDGRISGDNFALQEADAILTDCLDVAITIKTADCCPVYLYDSTRRVIGLIHAGWRGAQKQIVRKTVDRLRFIWQSDPRCLKVAIGPAIRQCCYEVGPEFMQWCAPEVSRREDRYYLDLVRVVKQQLMTVGVSEQNIFDREICTCCDENYFSYRREGAAAGRMISLMFMRAV